MDTKNTKTLSETINWPNRKLFLGLLDTHRPTLQQSLLEIVWPAFRACWLACPDAVDWRPSEGFTAHRRGPSAAWMTAPKSILHLEGIRGNSQQRDLLSALDAWCEREGIADGWIVDAALISMAARVSESPDPYLETHFEIWDLSTGTKRPALYKHPFWQCTPFLQSPQYSGPSFRPVFTFPFWHRYVVGGRSYLKQLRGHTVRIAETQKQFRDRIQREFRLALKNYLSSQNKRSEPDKNSQRLTHATWTVRFWSGEDPRDFAHGPGFRRYRDPESAVRKAAARFAETIALTLPTTVGTFVGSRNRKPGTNGDNRGLSARP